jgi:acetyltransferase-like isoleucine patch superfamily enzyme
MPSADVRRQTHWRLAVQACLLVLPWQLRRRLLNRLFGYRIHPTARIGLSLVVPLRQLELGPGARIGHLTVARGMDEIVLGPDAVIGRLNWLFALPSGTIDADADAITPRRTRLSLGRGAAIVGRHSVECSAEVRLDDFGIIGGWGTQLMTHAVDLDRGRLGTGPVRIGAYSLVGTRCILLPGAVLPARSALGAGSTLRTAETDEYHVYSGVPAVKAAPLSRDSPWMRRETFVAT